MALTTPSKRFTRQGWLAFSLQLLAENGPDILRLESVCEAAGKTRGSFYHHFEDHESFLLAVLEHWESLNTQQIIKLSDGAGKPEDRLKILNQLTAAVDKKIENGIRLLAARHPEAAHFVKQVDQVRLDYLTKLNMAYFSLSKAEAVKISELEYGLFIGLQTLFPNKDPEWFEGHGDHIETCLRAVYLNPKA